MLISTAGKSLTRTVWYHSRNVQIPVKCILLVPRRSKGTEDCIPPKRPNRLFAIAGIAIAGTTLAIVAAKHDDDFRDWTRKNMPTLDGLVKVVYKEEETYLESLHRAYKLIAEGFKNVLYNISQGIKGSGIKKEGTLEEVPKEKKTKIVYKSADSAFFTEDKKDDKGSSMVPSSMKHLKELEDRLFKDTQEAMQAHSLAVEAMKEKTNYVDNIDQMISRHDCKVWDKFKRKSEEEKMFSERFFEAVEKVEKSAENLRLQMSATPDLALDVKRIAENNINHSLGTVSIAKDNLIKDKQNQSIAKRSWDKVRTARMYFSEQLEVIFPNIWLNDEKLNVPVDRLDPFIENVLYNIQYAEKDLHKLETVLEPQIKNATEVVEGDSSETIDALIQLFVNIETGRERRLAHEEMQKALLASEAKCEKANRKSMKSLSEVYNDLKKEALSIRERDVERRMRQRLDEQLAQVRADYQLEMARMVGRIQGANEAVALRGDSEKGQQEKQQFWSAAQSLLSAVKPFGAKPKEPTPLKNEIKTLTKAAPDGDELVETVVSTIPQEAVEQGVVPRECLKARYLQLEKQARYLAALPAGPVSLVQHAVAWLQSSLYVDQPIPQAELNNEPIDVEQLNNYEILHRARYYVDRGELDQAVRYLNLLKGPSRKVAADWTKDVIVCLETEQAAELLMAHATTSNGKYQD